MRKWLVLAALAFCLSGGAFAQTEAAPRLGGGFFVDVFPVFNYSTAPSVPHSATAISDQALSEFYNRPTLLSAGVFLQRGPAAAVVTYEFQQDIWSWVEKKSLTNLPDDVDSYTPTLLGLGTLYPNLGYAEYDTEAWRLSLGRRKLQVGPGSIGLGLSSANPYYDHLAAGLTVPMLGGKLSYDYIAVVMQRTSLNAKYFALHRAAWKGEHFGIGLTDYNMLDSSTPDLQDIGPFIFYHNLFTSHSNVMLGIDFEARPVDDISIYGQFLLDDFQLGSEGAGSNQTAIGLSAGMEWRILPGEAASRYAFQESDHVYYVGHEASKRGGLTARLEGYLASSYLYRRDAANPYEAMTARYQIYSNWWNLGGTTVTPFLAAPLQPDTFLARLAVDWAMDRAEAGFFADYRLKGSMADMITFVTSAIPAGASWLWPSAPATSELTAGLKGLYSLDAKSIAMGQLSLTFLPGRVDFGISLGYGRRLGLGASPSL